MIEFNATFIIAMLSFVVFILIMNAIFYQPVLNIIRKREDYIRSNYETSENNTKNAKKMDEERELQFSTVQAKCRKEFYTEISKLQEVSAGQIKQAKEINKITIQNEKNRLSTEEAELKNKLQSGIIDNLADSITEKLLSNNQVQVRQ